MSNPHIEAATKLLEYSADGSRMPAAHQANAVAMAQAQATLALAYEQRTANLLALWANPSSTINGPHGDITWGISEHTVGKLLEQIQQRLGVDG